MNRTCRHEPIFFSPAPCPPPSAAENGNRRLSRRPEPPSRPARTKEEGEASIAKKQAVFGREGPRVIPIGCRPIPRPSLRMPALCTLLGGWRRGDPKGGIRG